MADTVHDLRSKKKPIGNHGAVSSGYAIRSWKSKESVNAHKTSTHDPAVSNLLICMGMKCYRRHIARGSKNPIVALCMRIKWLKKCIKEKIICIH